MFWNNGRLPILQVKSGFCKLVQSQFTRQNSFKSGFTGDFFEFWLVGIAYVTHFIFLPMSSTLDMFVGKVCTTKYIETDWLKFVPEES